MVSHKSFSDSLLTKTLTISNKHQGALILGFSIMDLKGVCALICLGEVLNGHLNDSCGSIVADLVTLNTYAQTTQDKHHSIKSTQEKAPHLYSMHEFCDIASEICFEFVRSVLKEFV